MLSSTADTSSLFEIVEKYAKLVARNTILLVSSFLLCVKVAGWSVFYTVKLVAMVINIYI